MAAYTSSNGTDLSAVLSDRHLANVRPDATGRMSAGQALEIGRGADLSVLRGVQQIQTGFKPAALDR